MRDKNRGARTPAIEHSNAPHTTAKNMAVGHSSRNNIEHAHAENCGAQQLQNAEGRDDLRVVSEADFGGRDTRRTINPLSIMWRLHNAT